jgi:ubiquinone/menaquinone biosynthesis C-methylase UbiE
MDDPAASPGELARSLEYIRRVNTLLGYARATVGHLERFSRRWKPGETVRILDVATGSADIPRAILRWSRRRGFDARVVAVDLHATTLKLAAAQPPTSRTPSPAAPGEGRGEGTISSIRTPRSAIRNPTERLQFVQADALHLPFADGSFDYALTAMFLHHLDDDAAAAVLREMDRVARRGIVAADLLRHRRAYAWVTLFTLLSGPMVKHDARASVAHAFTKPEVLALRSRAGVGYAKYHRHFAHRFALAGER